MSIVCSRNRKAIRPELEVKTNKTTASLTRHDILLPSSEVRIKLPVA